MSETVSKALLDMKDTTVEETAKFISMTDKFFDALNVTDINSGKNRRSYSNHPTEKLMIFILRYSSERQYDKVSLLSIMS